MLRLPPERWLGEDVETTVWHHTTKESVFAAIAAYAKAGIRVSKDHGHSEPL